MNLVISIALFALATQSFASPTFEPEIPIKASEELLVATNGLACAATGVQKNDSGTPDFPALAVWLRNSPNDVCDYSPMGVENAYIARSRQRLQNGPRTVPDVCTNRFKRTVISKRQFLNEYTFTYAITNLFPPTPVFALKTPWPVLAFSDDVCKGTPTLADLDVCTGKFASFCALKVENQKISVTPKAPYLAQNADILSQPVPEIKSPVTLDQFKYTRKVVPVVNQLPQEQIGQVRALKKDTARDFVDDNHVRVNITLDRPFDKPIEAGFKITSRAFETSEISALRMGLRGRLNVAATVENRLSYIEKTFATRVNDLLVRNMQLGLFEYLVGSDIGAMKGVDIPEVGKNPAPLSEEKYQEHVKLLRKNAKDKVAFDYEIKSEGMSFCFFLGDSQENKAVIIESVEQVGNKLLCTPKAKQAIADLFVQ